MRWCFGGEVDDWRLTRVGAARRLGRRVGVRAGRSRYRVTVFDVVPAGAEAESQTPAGEQLYLGCLFRDEGGLALWGDEDSYGEFKSCCDCREVSEEHEDLSESMPLVVGPVQRRFAIGMFCSEHVVVGEEVVEAEFLDPESESCDGVGGIVEVVMGKDGADPHVLVPLGRSLGGR
jgi:hypothetical protein